MQEGHTRLWTVLHLSWFLFLALTFGLTKWIAILARSAGAIGNVCREVRLLARLIVCHKQGFNRCAQNGQVVLETAVSCAFYGLCVYTRICFANVNFFLYGMSLHSTILKNVARIIFLYEFSCMIVSMDVFRSVLLAFQVFLIACSCAVFQTYT